MASQQMWTSKLGNKYPLAWMQQNDQASQKELKRLRSLKDGGNSICADCRRQDTTWASVSHGVFICVVCSDVHRSVGTHITKVKGCTGTYLWGPDELDKMRTVGNLVGAEIYGSEKISPDASKEEKQRFVIEKYEKRSFAGKAAPKAVNVEAPPQKEAMPLKVQREPDVKVATVRGNLSQEKVTPTQTAGTILAARQNVIPDSVFDDCFNEIEESCFTSSSVWSEPCKNQVRPATPAAADTRSSLDAFLDSTLQAPPVQPNLVADPFFDWPDF